MVQEFHVLRCYSCNIFQVQIVKKIKKWQCKVCNEKQSVHKVYFQGSGQECRLQVQHLNFMKHIKNERESEVLKRIEVIKEDDEIDEEDQKPLITHSKWTKYLVEPQKESHDDIEANDNDEIDQLSNFNSIDVVPINKELEENKKEKDVITKEGSWESRGSAYRTGEHSACSSSFSHSFINDDNHNDDNRCSLLIRNHKKRKFVDENTVKSRYKSYSEIELDSHLFLSKRTKFSDESSVRKKNLCDIIKSNRSKSGKCLGDSTEIRVDVRNGESVMNEMNESPVTNKLILSKPNIRKITVFESNYDDLDDDFYF